MTIAKSPILLTLCICALLTSQACGSETINQTTIEAGADAATTPADTAQETAAVDVETTAPEAQGESDESPGLDGLRTLFPDGIVDKNDNPIDLAALEGKVVGIYFSAHWCGPCRRFTPQLVKYRDKYPDDFEVVFVSSDRSAKKKTEYMKSAGMKWPSLTWRSKAADNLNKKFQVSGIPKLVLVSDAGETLTTDGRGLISSGVTPDRVKNARLVTEKYKCGKCDKLHSRQRLVFDDE